MPHCVVRRRVGGEGAGAMRHAALCGAAGGARSPLRFDIIEVIEDHRVVNPNPGGQPAALESQVEVHERRRLGQR